MKIWDLSQGNRSNPVNTIATASAQSAFSPDGHWLVVSSGGSYRFYAVGSWELDPAMSKRGTELTPVFASATALLALGKSEEALAEFQQIFPRDRTVALTIAQLLIERNHRLEPAKRNWKEVDEVLRYAKRAAPHSTEVAVLEAQLAQMKNPGVGLEMLQKQRDKDPSQPEPWLALIRMAESQGRDTLELIDESQKKLGDRVDLRLARARCWLRSQMPLSCGSCYGNWSLMIFPVGVRGKASSGMIISGRL